MCDYLESVKLFVTVRDFNLCYSAYLCSNVEYKWSNKEIKKVNEEYNLGIGFEDTFKYDNPILSFTSCANKLNGQMVTNFISREANIVLKIYKVVFPRGVMVKAMDCGIVVSEFVLQLSCYVHFRANTTGKDMNPLNLPAMG